MLYNSLGVKIKVSVLNYSFDDDGTAYLLAHEMGHTMDMEHDFPKAQKSDHEIKYSKSGQKCSNINAIMDYYQPNYMKWSTCSKEDIHDYYNKQKKKWGSFCLEEVTCCK